MPRTAGESFRMTALPTTVGETNTHPWVSNRQSASHVFAVLVARARSSARIGARCRSNIVATKAKDRLRMRPPGGCNVIVSRFRTALHLARLLRVLDALNACVREQTTS